MKCLKMPQNSQHSLRATLGSVRKLRLCHSERSEESQIQGACRQILRFFVVSSLRMTRKKDFAYRP